MANASGMIFTFRQKDNTFAYTLQMVSKTGWDFSRYFFKIEEPITGTTKMATTKEANSAKPMVMAKGSII